MTEAVQAPVTHSWARAFRRARLLRDMNQKQVSLALGFSNASSVSMIESGKSPPSEAAIAQAPEAFFMPAEIFRSLGDLPEAVVGYSEDFARIMLFALMGGEL